MSASKSFVFVIDDDESVRKSLKRLLSSADYEAEVFASATDFLARPSHPGPLLCNCRRSNAWFKWDRFPGSV